MTTHLRRSAVALIATMAMALSAAAQNAAVCLPGAGFGIESYNCASCGAEAFRDSARVTYKFGAEPVVMSAAATSQVKTGDVVIAVNGAPITTRAGADQFAYPPFRATLTVRRNGSNIDLSIPISGCALASYERGTVTRIINDSLRPSIGPVGAGGRGGRGGAGGSVGAVSGGGFAAGGRSGAPVLSGTRLSDSAITALTRARCGLPAGGGGFGAMPDSIVARLEVARKCVEDANRARVEMAALGGQNAVMATPTRPNTISAMASEAPVTTVEFRNFGLSLSCRPACVRVRARDGSTYWRFDGYPAFAITAATRDALAAKAGLRDGDVIISVNGLSPLTEEGALALAHSDRELTLTLEVSRAGKREKYTLKL